MILSYYKTKEDGISKIWDIYPNSSRWFCDPDEHMKIIFYLDLRIYVYKFSPTCIILWCNPYHLSKLALEPFMKWNNQHLSIYFLKKHIPI